MSANSEWVVVGSQVVNETGTSPRVDKLSVERVTSLPPEQWFGDLRGKRQIFAVRRASTAAISSALMVCAMRG
jgi:hypothetical protein